MKRRPVCLVCLLLMLCMFIMDRAGFPIITGNPASDSLQEWIEEHPQAVIRGKVQEYKSSDKSFSVCLSQVSLIVGSEQIPIDNVKAYLKENTNLKIGAVVELSGKLEEMQSPRNPGEFDSKQYYACRHIYYTLKNGTVRAVSREYSVYGQFLADIREYFVDILENAAGEEAGIFEAMLLGEKENLDNELKMRYQMAGVIHILAISGLHISVLGMGLFTLFKRVGFGNILSGFVSLFVMLQYALLTGGSVSAMRAVCMFALVIGARLLGRSYDLMTALAFSAVILLLDSPAYIESSSFLLSFAAVAGLGTVAPALNKIFMPKHKFTKSLLSSLAVQLTTLPLMLSLYGEVSLAGVFLNLIVLPTVSVVLVSGFFCALAGTVSLSLAFYLAVPGRVLLVFYEKICVLAAKIPYCTWIAGAPDLAQGILYYTMLMAGFGVMYLLKKRSRAVRVSIALFCIALGIFVLAYHPQKGLTITCLDVGQGDCAVISIPDGGTVLIDCGSTSKSKTGQYQLLPFLKHEGISYINAVVVSHTDEDHISGVRKLLSFVQKDLTSIDIGALIMPRLQTRSEEYEELITLAQSAGISVAYGCAGDCFYMGEAEFALLNPSSSSAGSDINEESLVMELTYRDFKGLFTGDIGEETEQKLLDTLEDVDFLKVAHHGSRYSSCADFLRTVSPEVAVVSCSETNTYGHPAAETIERLEDAGAKVYYTMKSGALILKIETEKITVCQFSL